MWRQVSSNGFCTQDIKASRHRLKSWPTRSMRSTQTCDFRPKSTRHRSPGCWGDPWNPRLTHNGPVLSSDHALHWFTFHSPLSQGSETAGIVLVLTPNWKHGKRAIWKHTPRGRAEKTLESWLPTTSRIMTAQPVSPHCLPYASVLKMKMDLRKIFN